MLEKISLIHIFIFISVILNAQNIENNQKKNNLKENNKTDSLISTKYETKTDIQSDITFKKKNPTRAALLSAILPGAGQAYNEKYWKIPIVYFVMGGLVYWADYNNKQYKRYLNAYVALTDDDKNTIDEFNGAVSSDNLLHYKNSFRRNRDISYIFIGVAYLLNIVDASVDAHFSDYDVGEDLSLRVKPVIMNFKHGQATAGISLSFRLK